MSRKRVTLLKIENISDTTNECLKRTGILDNIDKYTRIALKPNLTYPYYKRGVTTSPIVIRETVKILREYTAHISIVETDGGYGAWKAEEAFSNHGLYALRDEYGIEVVNLMDESCEPISFRSRWRTYQLPLPSRLLHDTDLLISMPVPKIHGMTGLTLSYKNQWGCIPDIMRLRRHYIFDDAIIAINRALRPAVLADGTYFLDQHGPMEGNQVRMDMIIGASDAGAFDRYVSELMGFPWQGVSYLKRAVKLGDMPAMLNDIEYNISPTEAQSHVFRLKRTMRDWIALIGFRSRFMTWLGYECWFGRVVLHQILYAIVGKPIKHHLEPINAKTISHISKLGNSDRKAKISQNN